MSEQPERVLFDTSVLVEVERGRLSVPRGFDAAISALTAAELLYGAARTGSARILRFAETIFEAIEVLPFDLLVARTYASVTASMDGAGRSIGVPDSIIATTALVHGRAVMTLNRSHFQRVPGLRVLTP
jgi:tRNA(fMet)-specific endonuclease VapC